MGFRFLCPISEVSSVNSNIFALSMEIFHDERCWFVIFSAYFLVLGRVRVVYRNQKSAQEAHTTKKLAHSLLTDRRWVWKWVYFCLFTLKMNFSPCSDLALVVVAVCCLLFTVGVVVVLVAAAAAAAVVSIAVTVAVVGCWRCYCCCCWADVECLAESEKYCLKWLSLQVSPCGSGR